MAEAKNLAELERKRPQLEGLYDAYRDRLKTGAFSPLELALTVHLSKDPTDYVHDTLSVVAAKMLMGARISLHAGEAIQFVVAQAHDKVKEWRVIPLAFIEDTFEFDHFYYEEMLRESLLYKEP